MVTYVYIDPGQGQTAPGDQNLLKKHQASVSLVIGCKFYPLNDFVTVFPIQTHRRQNLTLP